MKLRIATRQSALALAQTQWVAEQVRRYHPKTDIELVRITTRGDKIQDVALNQVGGKGLFVTEIEAAVLDGRADLAVHSLKDMPAKLAPGLALVCVPKREDPRDVLLSKDGSELEQLEAGERVGTSALRRRVQLHGIRRDLDYVAIRGNVDTRLAKLENGEYRAVVLAYAGLRRLGLDQRPLRILSAEQMVPAVGQGILAIEARERDQDIKRLMQELQDTRSHIEMVTERAFLEAIGGDCNVPLAGHASYNEQTARLQFNAMVGSTASLKQLRSGDERYVSETDISLERQAQQLGREVARRLLAEGAREMIEESQPIADVTASDPRSIPRS